MLESRGWILWKCDSCRRYAPNGSLYLLSDTTWHVRHRIFCIPTDHLASTVFQIPVRKIQWTDQFNWWMTTIERDGHPDMFATDWMRVLDAWVSTPAGWQPRRVDLAAPNPVGVT